MSLSRRVGLIVILVVIAFGSFCMFDLYRTLNISNMVIGYFKTNTDVVQISDFEYDINALLFTNSGDNENTYFATATGKAVSNYDNTKNYTVAINGIKANRVYDTNNYINSNFTNIFYSTNDTILLTDTLNIKVNFYTEGTKIIFLTQNGETAVSLWNSYIQKNGFKLTIIEDNFTPHMQADNLINYTINLYLDNVLKQSLIVNALSEESLPKYIDNKTVLSWKDINGNIYTELPLQNINLYAEIQSDKIIFELSNDTITTIDCGVGHASYGIINRKITSLSDIDLLETIFDRSVIKTGQLKLQNFYGQNYVYNVTNSMINDYWSNSSEVGLTLDFWATEDLEILFEFRYNPSNNNVSYDSSVAFIQGTDIQTFNQFYQDNQNSYMNFSIIFELTIN